MTMNIKPIKNERDFRRVLKEIDALMDATANTPEGDRLDVWVTLAEAWEEKHHAIDAPVRRT
jgi:HTH-type transcriptional regulator/antitoxin HigA